MNFFLISLCLVCLTGCGKGEGRQAERRVVYPALNDSPPPLLPTQPSLAAESAEDPEPQVLPNANTEESWMEKHVHKENLIKGLKEQAARAEPGDPFALSEEEIEKLSKLDTLEIY